MVRFYIGGCWAAVLLCALVCGCRSEHTHEGDPHAAQSMKGSSAGTAQVLASPHWNDRSHPPGSVRPSPTAPPESTDTDTTTVLEPTEGRGKASADDLARRARAHAHYAAGVIHEMNEEQDAALEEYFLAAKEDPGNETLILEVTRRFLQRKQPEKALELLVRAVDRPAASGAVYARLGLVYGQMGKVDQALSANRTAVKRSPQLLAGYQNLFVTLLQNKKTEDALKVLDEAARQNEVGPDFLIGLGELYANYVLQAPSQKTKVQERALAVLARAQKLNPPDVFLRLRLADTFNLLGASAKAAPIYLDLLKRLPDMPMLQEQLHAKLAGIYLRGSDHTNAIEQLQAVIREEPTNPLAYYYLGDLCYQERRQSEAIDYFNKAILLKADFAEPYYGLALAQLSLNKSAEALDTLETARKKFPESFALDYYSGLACSEKKDYAGALRHFTAAEVLAKATEPGLLDRGFYFELGAAYERTGDYEHAEQYFQKCLELSPDWAEACNYLGYMWADRGVNLEKARALIEKAVKAEPKNAAYLDSLAWALYKQNQAQEALRYMLQAIDLSKEPDPTLLDHLGDIYTALKEPQKAREAWEKSLKLEPNDSIQKKLDSAGGK